MTEPEVRQKLRDLRQEVFNLRFRHATNPVDNPLRMRSARREIALLETLLGESASGARPLAGSVASGAGEEKKNG